MTTILSVYPEVGEERWISLLITQETDVSGLFQNCIEIKIKRCFNEFWI
jgi:hypothetical protein